MKIGFSRFDFYLQKLGQLLAEAEKGKDPANYLYANDARTTFFMLEGLARLYGGIYKVRYFEKIRSEFKVAEDALGAIDYYDGFAKEFLENQNIPITVTAYLQSAKAGKMELFKKSLLKMKWIGSKKSKLTKIRKKLSKLAWKKEKKDIKGLASFYHESIESIKVLALESGKGFTELEEEVHELRRQLRWLSIYPKAMQGAIQLIDSGKPDQQLERYLTPEIINSPFNQMPDGSNCRYFLLLEKNNFLALSWMISALGRLKDNGLRIFALREALEQTEGMDSMIAYRISCEVLGAGDDELQNILDKASIVSHDYFSAGYLDELVHGGTKR